MGKKRKNICFLLINREITATTYNRKGFQILRTLICHSDRKFTKVWEASSKTNFRYESGRLFSEHFKVCHFGYAVAGGPVVLYKQPKLYHCKLEDALIYKCFHENFDRHDNKAYLFGLQSQGVGGSLVLYSLDTGQKCQQIFLSNTIKFKQIAWVEPNEMFVVRSKQRPNWNSIHGAIANTSNVAVVIAVFAAFPFKFIGMFEVDKRVFGPYIHYAILSHGLLIVMLISGHVYFYSFQYILEKYKLFDYSLDQVRDHNAFGQDNDDIPQGLPMNIKISERPPVLFEVRCAEHDVQIGGFPWHYIMQPYGTLGLFNVYSLKDDKKAKQGCLESNFTWTEADRCVFHNDNSGRILHLRAPEIGVHRLITDIEGGTEQCTLGTETVISLLKDKPKDEIMTTSSGRSIKKPQLNDEVDSDQDVLIHQVDYEDDLDLTWISAFCKNRDKPNVVCLYDNQNLELLCEIELQHKWDEVYEDTVYMDLDTIIQVVRPQLGMYSCTMYRLSGSELPTHNIDSSKKSGKGRTGSRRNNRNSGTTHRVTRPRTAR